MTEKDYGSIDDALVSQFQSLDIDEPDDAAEDAEDVIGTEEPELTDSEESVEETTSEEAAVEEPKPVEKAKQDKAFAEMRIAKAEAERKAKEEEQFLSDLAAQSGFSDIEKFKAAVQKELSKKKADAAGVNPEVFEKMQGLEKRLAEMEEEKSRIANQQKAFEFDAAVKKFVSDYELGAKGDELIFQKLTENGYTVEEILTIKNPEVFIKGVMADVIQEKALKTHLKKKEDKAKVDNGRIDSSGTVDADTWEDILSKDLEKYAKENGYNR